MSGTSADAIDAVAVNFIDGTIKIIGHHSESLPPHIRKTVHQLATPGANEIDLLGALDVQLGELFATTASVLLRNAGLDKTVVNAIGSHGQTLRHRPPGSIRHPFTLQIGDPNIIAQRTGITTVADFRRRDMAAGGQGAPLVPAFHEAAFRNRKVNRAIVNIGGIANITWLPYDGTILGFDTGPGNVLMDGWILKNQGKSYDAAGAWAASGTPIRRLLDELLAHPFLKLPYPKSTGREAFNPSWVEATLQQHNIDGRPEDVQATLLAFTAHTIVNDISALIGTEETEIYICGGGAYNTHLLTHIQNLLPTCPVATTSELGIAPEWIEATAFAWLARQTLNRRSGNLCAVTGASQPVILGGVYFV